MSVELDYFEVATDAGMQAAYVTNGIYDSNFLTGGTATADEYYDASTAPSKAFDGSMSTYWQVYPTTGTHWIKYDLGAGVTKIASKMTTQSTYNQLNAFTIQGSTDNTNWDLLYSGNGANNDTLQTFTFSNSKAHRYYLITITSQYTSGNLNVYEIQMMELCLQSYSESTIKTQGSYSLKAIASTSSLNKTLTRTVSPTIDLTGQTKWKFDMRASRTGSNVKVGIHDSGGTTTETTPNIASADTFQTVVVDISGVADADKNAIDQIIITPTNADAANTVYFDNMFAEIPALGGGLFFGINF